MVVCFVLLVKEPAGETRKRDKETSKSRKRGGPGKGRRQDKDNDFKDRMAVKKERKRTVSRTKTRKEREEGAENEGNEHAEEKERQRQSPEQGGAKCGSSSKEAVHEKEVKGTKSDDDISRKNETTFMPKKKKRKGEAGMATTFTSPKPRQVTKD